MGKTNSKKEMLEAFEKAKKSSSKKQSKSKPYLTDEDLNEAMEASKVTDELSDEESDFDKDFDDFFKEEFGETSKTRRTKPNRRQNKRTGDFEKDFEDFLSDEYCSSQYIVYDDGEEDIDGIDEDDLFDYSDDLEVPLEPLEPAGGYDFSAVEKEFENMDLPFEDEIKTCYGSGPIVGYPYDEVDDEYKEPLFNFVTKSDKKEIEQYITVEFEVREKIKPVFKQILDMMRLFRYDTMSYDEIVSILTGLVKNINLESGKINWHGWRQYVGEKSIFGERSDIFKYSVDDFKKAGVSVDYIEKSCPVVSYMERERLSREFLDCYQKDRSRDYRDIIRATWMELTHDRFSDKILVENIRKDPRNPFGESEKVYCTVKFLLNYAIAPVLKAIGQFIGTFGYDDINELNVTAVKYNISQDGLEEKVELFGIGNVGVLTIAGFGDVEDNLDYFKKDIGELPSEINIPLQNINTSCEIDVELEINPVLNESMQILSEYIAYCKNYKHVTTREILSEVIELLSMEIDITKKYIDYGLGLNIEEATEEELNYSNISMVRFAKRLPTHLRDKVLAIYPDKLDWKEDDGLHLYEDIYDMIGYIKDTTGFEFRFVPKPFKADDPNEPEIMDKVFIKFKATIVGTNVDDLKYQYRKIEKNIKAADIKFREFNS